jgi:hypothetical protein
VTWDNRNLQSAVSQRVLLHADVMVDLADRIYAPKGTESQSGARLVQMSTNILFFAIGCGAAALLYSRIGVKCFVVPPIVGSLQLIVCLASVRGLLHGN